ncbi:MAG: RagB/SusD family nutrient uptake outer membrane protein [Muribaculaceae bacterium]
MKAIYKTIALASAMMLSLASCGDDFLDVTPKGSLTPSGVLSNSQAEEMLLGCYDGYQTAFGYGGANFQLASEIMSDNCFAGGGTGDETSFQAIDRFDKGLAASENMLEAYWKHYYYAINRCNTLLQAEETTEWRDDASRNNTIGQARALRALCYFDLVRLFGSVPLLTEPSVDKVAQAEPSEIFELIAADLKYAADNISFGSYEATAWAANSHGLISEWAAKALLARVYLFYTGFYNAQLQAVSEAEVKSALLDVINHSGFALVDDFARLWPAASRTASLDSYSWTIDNYAGESNEEVIFAVKFDTSTDQDASNSNGNAISTNNNGTVCMMSMRNVAMPPYGKGWGVASANPKLFLAFSSDDTRRRASFIDMVGEGVTDLDSYADVTDWRENTGYVSKKYTCQCYYDGSDAVTIENSAASFQYSQGQDMILMRYADVLLMAAELGCDGAQNFYNMVRDRAFGDTAHHRSLTKDNIIEERRLEFAFEGLRYWDLLRSKGISGTAQILEENQNGVKVTNGKVEGVITFSASNMIEKQGLMQKPGNQITLMGTDYLKQNQGW